MDLPAAVAPNLIKGLKFDPASHVIISGGRRTPLDIRSSRIFALLADRMGEAVGKEDLLRAAWPDQLVHENSLAKAISKLRRAIAGSGLEISACYGVGYRLHSSDEQPESGDTAASAFSGPPLPTTKPPSLWIAALPGVAAILILVSAIFVYLYRDPDAGFWTQAPITHDAPDARATILWVDDHPSNNAREVAFLKARGIAVHLAQSTNDALKLIQINHYPLVVSDLGRGEDRLAGLQLIAAMRQHRMAVPVVIYTVRPKAPAGQIAQQKIVADSGAAALAVTPQEIRSEILRRLAKSR